MYKGQFEDFLLCCQEYKSIEVSVVSYSEIVCLVALLSRRARLRDVTSLRTPALEAKVPDARINCRNDKL